jgi:type VI secretion system protein ImpL
LLAYLLALVVLLVAGLLAFFAGTFLHLHGTPLIVLTALIVLAGLIAAVAILVIHYRARKRQAANGELPGGGSNSEVDVLLIDANRKLRNAKQQGAKPLDGLPLLYLLGEAGSAKTSLVMRSGLDPELIAGSAPREGDVSPTPVLNLWFTRQAAILEAGQTIRQTPGALQRMIARTRPKAYRSTFGSGAPARAAVVCVSVEQFLVADAATSSVASARIIAAQLREISRLLGAALPVYVIFTKLDRIPHFAEYVRNLSNDEIRQVLGNVLPANQTSAGVYADKMSRDLASALDLLTYSLGEFRVEVLNRETEPQNAPGAYEFPREFGKLRRNINQYLVELCKPSQLSANPYLRGFFFTGLRAQILEQRAAAQAAPVISPAAELGATRMFSAQEFQAANRPAAQQMVATRAPQWTFLPRLFPEVILGDRSALSATQQTAPARLFRRILFASLAFVFAAYTVLLVVSYLNNAALERNIQSAAQALSAAGTATAPAPGLADLQALDRLRQSLLQLEGYAQNGPPWTYRFGLYQGDKLAVPARQIYFDRFRVMMLNPTQANFATYLRGLPVSPAPGADYTAAYNPLKAYLITTSNPEKSQAQFLTPVFLQYWMGSNIRDLAQQQLARQQIDFYAGELLRQNPYSIAPDAAAVGKARTYLSNFGAVPRIYQDVLAQADKTSPGVDFNRLYPNAAGSVVESHLVRGAFTRAGFAFMQGAMQHPEHYFQGETWVLGDQAARSLDSAGVAKQLAAMYSADFLREWHAFLNDGHFTGCGPIRDLPNKLNALAGPDSPLLEFFGTASYNTAVNDPQIKSIFQPTQALVDPGSTARFIGPGNTAYVNALLALSSAVTQFNQNPQTSGDMLGSAVSTAGIAVQQTAQPFNIDPQMHTEKTVLALLEAPIHCAVPPPPPPPPGAPGAMCTLLGKFPFQPLSKAQAGRDLTPADQASLADVNAVFAPGTGSLWTYYNASLKPWLLQQGTQYVLAPNAAGHVGPVFAQFFNRAASISSTLYSSGGTNPAFTFTLRSVPSKGIENATLVVDGQRIPAGATSQPFTWNGATAHQASLAYNSAEALQFQGPWALFQLVATAQVTRVGGTLQLEFPLEVSGRQLRLPDGTPEVVRFEISGPGAAVLAPLGLYGGTCVNPVTK